MMSPEQKAFSRYFEKPPILYIAGLGRIFGLPGGILLNHLLYWNSKGSRKDGFIYKTEKDITAETGLTRTQQDTAIRRLTKAGVIEYKLAQVPAKKHFKVNVARLHEILPSLKEIYNLPDRNPPMYIEQNGRSITEITRKNKSKNTTDKPDKSNFAAMRKKLIQSKALPGSRGY